MAELKNYVEGQPIEPSRPIVYTTIEEQAELKAYREFGTLHQLRVLCDRYHELISRPTEADIRAKAIEEFAEKLKESLAKNYRHFITTDTDGFDWLTTDAVGTHIDKIAEQLKGE